MGNYGDAVISAEIYVLSVFLIIFVNKIININQSNMIDGVSALFDIIHSYGIRCFFSFSKRSWLY